MKKKVLVTGGAGFIGSHLVDALIKEGYSVRVLDNLDPQVHGENRKIPSYLNKEAEFIEGDIRNRDILKKSLKDIEVIFHEAAAVGVGQSMYQIYRYVEVNTLGTANLLDILVNERNKVEKIICASSMSIYGEGKYRCRGNCGIVYPQIRSEDQLKRKQWEPLCPNCGAILEDLPTDETKPLHPTSIYAITKRDTEELILNFGIAYRLPVVALRYFNVYGPRQALNNPYTGVAAIFSCRLLNNNPPIIYEDGHQKRDFIHVSDVVRANILAMEKKEADYQAINIGTGEPHSILEVAKILIEKINKSVSYEVVGKARKGDIRHCYADIARAKELLGFSPRISFEEGIKDLTDWVATQQTTDAFEQAKKELETRGLI